jgi:hypothetical protein
MAAFAKLVFVEPEAIAAAGVWVSARPTINRRVLVLGFVLVVPLVILLLLNLDRDPHLVASPPWAAAPRSSSCRPSAAATPSRSRPCAGARWS